MIVSNSLKDEYSSKFFILRTPVLSYEKINELYKAYSGSERDMEEFIYMQSKQLINIEGIYIASPDFHAQLQRFLTGEKLNPKAKKKMIVSFYEYITRMATRSTPFGIFAGCSIGFFEKSNSLIRCQSKDIKRYVRLDMDLSYLLVAYFLKNENIYRKLKYYPNSSIYTIKKQYRYTEYRFNSKGQRTHHIVSVDKISILSYILQISKNGLNYEKIVESVKLKGFDDDNTIDYVDELIRNQLLVSEIEPNVTGNDFIKRLIEILQKRISIEEPVLQTLINIQEGFETIDRISDRVTFYKRVIESIRKHKIGVHENRTFQIDSYFPTEKCTLDRNLQTLVLEGLDVLRRLNPMETSNLKIHQFKNAFTERYEQAMVPLAEALDTEIGLGYKKALSISDYYKVDKGLEYLPSVDLKIRKFQEWRIKNADSIEITESEIQNIPINNNPVPNSFSVTISLIEEALDDNPEATVYIKSASGPSGANLIGRFAHSNPKIEKELIDLCKQEEALSIDKIFAEIVHLPQARIGNILSRPHLREYEIPYLATSTLGMEHKILINDLYLMVRNNRLFLYSKKMNKEIVPRLSTAHNFSNGLPIYNFLCDLQYQNCQPGIFWDWGILTSQTHLPRVTYKKMVLSPETWNFKAAHFSKFINNMDANDMVEQFHEVRKKYKVPDQILIVESDNLMLVNLSFAFGVKYFIKCLKKKQSIKLIEDIQASYRKVVKNNKGCFYNNEIIIPFVRNTDTREQINKNIKVSIPKIGKLKRKFSPGSEWLYFKLYISHESTNLALSNNIYPFIKKLLARNIINKWFFIRYGDPKHHIRLRLHLTDPLYAGYAIKELYSNIQTKLNTNVVWNLQLDTYVREIERYGYNTIEQSEYFFYLNSELTIKFINSFPEITTDMVKRFCLIGVDTILEAFNYTLDEKIDLTKRGTQHFFTELNVQWQPQLREYLSSFFRNNRKDIEDVIGYSNKGTPSLFGDLIVMKKLSTDYYNKLKKFYNNTPPFFNLEKEKLNLLIYSYMHMFVNRAFATYYRDIEYLILAFLEKLYSSQKARSTKNAEREC